jgi:hypothetical protein
MVIYSEIELVEMTHDQALKYVPPAGVDVNWLEFMPSKNQVYIEFLCSDLQPDPILRKSIKDIHHELETSDFFRNHVLRKNVGSHPKAARRRKMMVETNLSNPLLAEAPAEIRRAAEEATDVHDVLYDPKEIENAVLESSFRFSKESMPGVGGTGRYERKLRYREPDEVVQERFYRQEGPDQHLVEEYGPERYKYKMGVIDIG